MTTRQQRLYEFSQAEPPAGEPLQVLCEDHSGTYMLPYPCSFADGNWISVERNTVIAAKVVGWRVGKKGFQNRHK